MYSCSYGKGTVKKYVVYYIEDAALEKMLNIFPKDGCVILEVNLSVSKSTTINKPTFILLSC